MEIKGYLFDVYNFESDIHVWIKDEQGNMHLFRDVYHPIIYADAEPQQLRRLVERLSSLKALAAKPEFVIRKHFYRNTDIRVLRLAISRPSLLSTIKRKLYAMIDRIDIYHSDVEIPNGYMHEKHIYPFAPVIARVHKPPLWNKLDAIVALESEKVLDYDIPPLRIMEISMEKSHRLAVSTNNQIILRYGNEALGLSGKDLVRDIQVLNQMVLTYDPDVILTSYGDQKIMPTLFTWSSTAGIPLALDRDQVPGLQRNIVRKGLSVNTYGSWLFRAASYPLYGRLHIDSGNSFIFSNSDFAGVVELARLSRTPVQRVARTSTGAALTNMEFHNAMDRHYLVPWQKSKVESWRSVYAMIEGDKGGLIFQPDISSGCVFENIAQLDYSQMYPTIMVNHNISPECVNCECCADDPDVPRTPESNWHICKRRQGIVSQTLSHILKRRKHYKGILKQGANPEVDAKQGALKWLLVTSFGYLGYRNAKFGRLESHEAVTSYGREKVLQAKECAEAMGFECLHAITDSLFIRNPDKSPISADCLATLCQDIERLAGIEMAIEGVYKWAIFFPSKVDEQASVANRYMGLFANGKLKTRGIFSRRKDIPAFIKTFQLAVLEQMQSRDSVATLYSLHPLLHELFLQHRRRLQNYEVPWTDLLIRRTATRSAGEYAVSTGTALALDQMKLKGIEVQAGEKIRYLVLNRQASLKEGRYLSEESAWLQAHGQNSYDLEFYYGLLVEAYEEVWQFFAPAKYFMSLRQMGVLAGLFDGGS